MHSCNAFTQETFVIIAASCFSACEQTILTLTFELFHLIVMNVIACDDFLELGYILSPLTSNPITNSVTFVFAVSFVCLIIH